MAKLHRAMMMNVKIALGMAFITGLLDLFLSESKKLRLRLRAFFGVGGLVPPRLPRRFQRLLLLLRAFFARL